MKQPPQPLYEFSGFRLDPAQRILVRDGEPVVLARKAFETLLFLVQNSGRVLEKDELMQALWPESFVEEGNLSQNIFVLRKILGDDRNGHSFIQTVPRRGYKFVATVTQLDVASLPGVSGSLLSANYWNRHSPFRGLRAFEAEDAWLFFGRESQIEELLVRLGRTPVLVVIGNSGCGKSSLVRAGLIPALQAGRFPIAKTPHHQEWQNQDTAAAAVPHEDGDFQPWRVAVVRPSGAPFDYLAEVLPRQLAPELSLREQADFIAGYRDKLPLGGEALRNAISALAQPPAQENAAAQEPGQTRILLVVDQFEELFTLTASHEIHERYIDALLAAARWDASVPVHLVLVLRADFYPHCLEHGGLSRCLEENLYNVPRMTQEQLREAIEKRLALAGARMDSGLMDALLHDVGAEPGNLALLEHALSQLWEKHGGFGCTLTSEAYAAIGRLRGALSAHADSVYGEIENEAQKQLVQRIFLELVQLGDGAPDTRRRVPKAELLALGSAEPQQVEALLARLASSRLIAISGQEGADDKGEGEAFVEVSHEALIREWSTLREWIAQNREDLKLGRRLVQAAQEWDSLSRDPGALLQGARLAQGEDWLRRYPDASALVRQFLEASVAARVEAEERELRKQRAAATRQRWFSSALAGLLLAALVLIWFAHKRQLLTQSRALAAQSESMLARDQGQALDLAMRAWSTAKTDEAYTAVTNALPETLNVLGHAAEVTVAAFSPDGKRILTASWDCTARVWSTADGRLLATLQGHTDHVVAAAFSPDGRRIVTGGEDHTARIWDSSDGRLLATLRGHTNNVWSVGFSPDGQRIVTSGYDRTPRVWSAADGRLLATLEGHTDSAPRARFSPDGERILTASYDYTVRLWSAVDGHLLVILVGHTDSVRDAAFSPDGQRIVTASEDRTARIWNTTDGGLLAILRGHTDGVLSATFSPDGRQIVTGSKDHTARIWNTADGRPVATLKGHTSWVWSADFSPDGQRIVTGSRDHTAWVWDGADGRPVVTLQGHAAAVMRVSFSPDGQRIVTASYDGTARVWNANTVRGRTLLILHGHSDWIRVALFSPDGQRIVTAGRDSTARVWSSADGRMLAVLQGHADQLGYAEFSPDGRRVVTASYNGTARVWNAVDGRLLFTLQGHTDRVWSATFSPDGQRIVTASRDGTARVWSSSDGRLLATLQGHAGKVIAATFSPDGLRVVTASEDRTARIWSAVDGRSLATLEGHTDMVFSARFSPDGRRVVTGSNDHTARVWSSSNGRLLAILQGHTKEVYGATFSPDGQRILTASNDYTVKVWNSDDGRLLATLEGHTYLIDNVEFSPDGKRILTASMDHTARLWNATDGHLLTILHGHSDEVSSATFSPDGQRILTASADGTARVWQVLTLEDIQKFLAQR
jgi:WD40 repeat protein/DNA-binding winged helix-turn-helix (wHTH) protein